ncbi:MAG: patatin-like phospholipase family protein [Pseudomonadales bacterium]|nr:patatin-like phospholipase family protein [Pseudomonadales bacterium]
MIFLNSSLRLLPKTLALTGAALLLQGCVNLLPPGNQATTTLDPANGYGTFNTHRKPVGEHQVILAFSGGGTRAAALSYGVLEELRDTRIIDPQQTPERLLDEVDLISSVSGGSFTAAYYGLYGDDIFKNYEGDFLRTSVQSSLIRNLLSPRYWFHAMFSGINRTDMAVDYYNRTIFHDATFADFPIDKRPFIEINATDLATGAHFSFAQGYFDVLCSDLKAFPVARAVTASSGVPIAFPPVTLKNHADSCNPRQSYLGPMLNKTAFNSVREEQLIRSFNSYLDAQQRPYIHLVDGGVSDNLGLRAIMDRNELINKDMAAWHRRSPVRDLLIILVNAEVKPKKTIDQSYQTPSMAATAGALTDALISRYTVETRALIKAQMADFDHQAKANGEDVRFYLVEVDFSAFDSPGLQQYFNNLPTTLELSNDEVDVLIEAGRDLLRKSEPYQQFLQNNRGFRIKTPEVKKACSLSNITACVFAQK